MKNNPTLADAVIRESLQPPGHIPRAFGIKIPKGRDPIKLARAVVKISRRRAHQVRGHWRAGLAA